MAATPEITRLAADLAGLQLTSDPFQASYMGIAGYEDAVPDLSPEYQQAWRGQLVDVITCCDRLEGEAQDIDSRVLLGAVREEAMRALCAADSRVEEFTVSTAPMAGPPAMLMVVPRVPVTDAPSAASYLTRCRRLPGYLDQHTQRLRAAAADGLLPVTPLVDAAIRQLREHLSHPARDPLRRDLPAEGWAGATTWRDEVERVVRDDIRPAIGRYADLLAELLPRSRPGEQAGLLHLPGGVAAYACCVRNGTTLALDPGELHRTGLAAVAEAEQRMAELGGRVLGARDAGEVMAALRGDCAQAARPSGDALARAAMAVTRAQDQQADMFHPPMPPPCSVEAMPAHMADFSAPPFYVPPSRDGKRAGTYLFNAAYPGQAATWALEATTFHETVPGHHAQFARLQAKPDLPVLLTAFYVVAHGEGWGLYAEQLADEFGLYCDDMQRLGMLGCALWRAVRLVVDSGLHARGWSRTRAREYARAHSPMSHAFVEAEIDRYIAVPGQALGYLTGQREILRLREDARARLGAAYDIRDFHAAVLDHGSVPLAVLGQAVDAWLTSVAGGQRPY